MRQRGEANFLADAILEGWIRARTGTDSPVCLPGEDCEARRKPPPPQQQQQPEVPRAADRVP